MAPQLGLAPLRSHRLALVPSQLTRLSHLLQSILGKPWSILLEPQSILWKPGRGFCEMLQIVGMEWRAKLLCNRMRYLALQRRVPMLTSAMPANNKERQQQCRQGRCGTPTCLAVPTRLRATSLGARTLGTTARVARVGGVS